MKRKKRILALAPHTDDVELGCGGTLNKFRRRGYEIDVVALSSPEDKPQIEIEFAHSMGSQGFRHELRGYKVRNFTASRQEILEDLVELSRRKNYDIVFCPSTDDRHQDHEVVANETFRAFKDTSIWGYELPWNHREFKSDIFVALSPENLEAKMKSLAKYISQRNRPYFSKEVMESLARTRGIQIGRLYAEAFENIRTVVG